MMAYYIVFGTLLDRGTEDYVVFLLVGLVPWFWFNRTVSNATGSIVAAKGLMQQVKVSKLFFPSVVILKEMFRQAILFAVLIVFLLLYGTNISSNWLALLPLMLIELYFILAVSFFVAAITPFMLDIRYLVNSGLQFLMFGSGVFFSFKNISEENQWIFFLNPLAVLLKDYRSVVMEGAWPDLSAYSLFLIIASVLLSLSIRFIHKMDKIYPKVI